MITVRTYGNLAEAGFAKSLLEAAGISSELADEHSYGLGYGPGIGGLRLQVPEKDLERARQVLAEGLDSPEPAAPPKFEAVDSRPEEKEPRAPVGILLALGVALAALLFAVAQWRERQSLRSSSSQSYEDDLNHDGRPDQFYSYRGEFITSWTLDRNRDGKIDEWHEYAAEGKPTRILEDNNFDGQVDGWFEMEDGDLKTSLADTDFNGIPDVKTDYKNQLPIRSVYTPNGSKTPTRIYIFKHGNAVEELVDSDADGKMDYRILRDAFANPSERLPIGDK